MHKLVEDMNSQIEKAKTLMAKSKEMKDQLKFDISVLDDEIDDHITLIG